MEKASLSISGAVPKRCVHYAAMLDCRHSERFTWSLPHGDSFEQGLGA